MSDRVGPWFICYDHNGLEYQGDRCPACERDDLRREVERLRGELVKEKLNTVVACEFSREQTAECKHYRDRIAALEKALDEIKTVSHSGAHNAPSVIEEIIDRAAGE